MGIKINRKDDLDKIFGKFAQLDPHDKKRDDFLKPKSKAQKNQKENRILKQDETKS